MVKKKTEEEMKAMEYYRMTKSDAGKAAGMLARMRPKGPGGYAEWAVASDYLNKLSLKEKDKYTVAFDAILNSQDSAQFHMMMDLMSWHKHQMAKGAKMRHLLEEAAHAARSVGEGLSDMNSHEASMPSPLLILPSTAKDIVAEHPTSRQHRDVTYRTFL